MPRSPRLHAPNLVYHIYARGNNREAIFFEKGNYERFLLNLEKYRIPLQYKIFAYCLLRNHFHLLLQVGNTSISKIMQIVMTAYTMYINKKYEHVGHIFQGRFQSIIVDKNTYFLQVFRYIHLNSVKAGLALNPQDYPWSSYSRYETQRADGMPFLEIAEVLPLFSQDSKKQRNLLHEFTLGGLQDTFDPFKEQVRGVLGSAKFRQKLTKVFRGVRP